MIVCSCVYIEKTDRLIMNPTINKIINMMVFLEAEDYIIPSFGLPLPDDIKNYDCIGDRVFRFYRRTGTMSYTGESKWSKRITVMGITLPYPYINALHDALVSDIKRHIEHEKKKTHMAFLPQVLCRFGGIEFILDNWHKGVRI